MKPKQIQIEGICPEIKEFRIRKTLVPPLSSRDLQNIYHFFASKDTTKGRPESTSTELHAKGYLPALSTKREGLIHC
jgi:hypothetical protein